MDKEKLAARQTEMILEINRAAQNLYWVNCFIGHAKQTRVLEELMPLIDDLGIYKDTPYLVIMTEEPDQVAALIGKFRNMEEPIKLEEFSRKFPSLRTTESELYDGFLIYTTRWLHTRQNIDIAIISRSR